MDPRITCCFSGHQPEKMPGHTMAGPAVPPTLNAALSHAICAAVQDGYHLFVTGMSRGFDLWAAQTVLKLRRQLPIRLVCAIPFPAMPQAWSNGWRTCYREVLRRADAAYTLSSRYTPDCYYVRNRFMVDHASRLICWFDGTPGGTAFTYRCAKRRGLDFVNLSTAEKDAATPSDLSTIPSR